MLKVAIVGTGISGMSCAHRLYREAEITLFESEMQAGGHTHTVDVPNEAGEVPVDTGFMVYNEETYPRLTRLFKDLGVETIETSMSFSVQHRLRGLEFCGTNLNRIFAQRKNILNPRFVVMLREILRFNKLAVKALQSTETAEQDLKEFVERHRFSPAFLNCYLVPMTSAIWSTPPDEMLRFPAQSLLRFMHNHGLLGVSTHHQWRTVKGGSRQYRDKLIAPFRDRIRCSCPVVSVTRDETGVILRDINGTLHRFDKAILATHADTSLKLLEAPTAKEKQLLGCFPYSKNRITLHSDETVMPKASRAWASWNYRIDALEDGRSQASTHYWMNSLQHLPGPTNYFVSVNEPEIVDRNKVFREFTFDHPMFSKAAAEAQKQLPALNENRRVYFCGSYFRYGFHEDGLMSGFAAAERVLEHASAAHAKLAI